MAFNFDQWIDSSHSDSLKWNKYIDKDIIPLWVADTDFLSPPPVIEALQQRVAHGVFGYSVIPDSLKAIFIQRVYQRYQWKL